MNEVMKNVMTFINEHTLLLIGICVFLILVLIGYLIDNSVKSKRIRKDIKNKDQVPTNIKEEIIREAEDKMIKKDEDFSVVSDNKKNMQAVDLNSAVPSEPVALDEPIQPESDIKFDDIEPVSAPINVATEPVNPIPTPTQEIPVSMPEEVPAEIPALDLQVEPVVTPIIETPVNIATDNLLQEQPILTPAVEPVQVEVPMPTPTPVLEPIQVQTPTPTPILEKDPDQDIMMPQENGDYTNDKGLSEILFSTDYTNEETKPEPVQEPQISQPSVNPQEEVNNIDIFSSDNSSNIVVNSDVDKNDVQIENNNSSDELDRIMRKLSTMNNNIDDDNYTNIF